MGMHSLKNGLDQKRLVWRPCEMTIVPNIFINFLLKLKKTSVKTLLNDLHGYLIFKWAFTAKKLAKIKNNQCEDLGKWKLSQI